MIIAPIPIHHNCRMYLVVNLWFYHPQPTKLKWASWRKTSLNSSSGFQHHHPQLGMSFSSVSYKIYCQHMKVHGSCKMSLKMPRVHSYHPLQKHHKKWILVWSPCLKLHWIHPAGYVSVIICIIIHINFGILVFKHQLKCIAILWQGYFSSPNINES